MNIFLPTIYELEKVDRIFGVLIMFALLFVILHVQCRPFYCLVILLNIAAELTVPTASGSMFQNKMLLNTIE